MTRTPKSLIGQCVAAYTEDAGWRSGRVVAVDFGPRKGFRSVTFTTGGAYGMTPKRHKVTPEQLDRKTLPVGVCVYRGIIPLSTWLKGGAS